MTVWAVKYVAMARGVFIVRLFKERAAAAAFFEDMTKRFRRTLREVDGSSGNVIVDDPGRFHWHGHFSGDIKVSLDEEEVR